MNILVFKTDIRSPQKVRLVGPVFRGHPSIIDWSVDIEDIDHVLRIVTLGTIRESDIIRLVKKCGFRCEILDD